METDGGWHETRVRVRYGEVDRMGVVYHGHYLVYFEQGRTELLRSLGATYRELEEAGTLLVVTEAGLRFHRPGRYDDELSVRTRLSAARGVRLRFDYEVHCEELHLASGHTVLAATDPSGRPRRLPEGLERIVRRHAPHAVRKGGTPADVQQEARG
jgi:acyl-CoA thioester hydrolase